MEAIPKIQANSPLVLLCSNIAGLVSEAAKIYIIIVNPVVLIMGGGFIDMLFGISSSFLVIMAFNYYEASYLDATHMSFATLFAIYAISSSSINYLIGLLDMQNSINPAIFLFFGFGPLIFFDFITISINRMLNRMKITLNQSQLRLVKYLKIFNFITFGGVASVYTLLGFLGIAENAAPSIGKGLIVIFLPEL